MKPNVQDLGHLLGSVALRYRSTLAGEENTPLLDCNNFCFKKGFFRNQADRVGHNPSDDGISRLEALLFLSRQPQTSRKLAQLTGLADGTKARTLVRTLNRRYDAEGSAFRVEEVAGGFQLMTRSKFAPWLRRLQTGPAEVRLSAPALESLAVVAYRQPVLRVEIEAIRGVQSGEMLRQLIERDLVRIVGRSNELGRPFLYGTTKQFLQLFGLRHLDELPQASNQPQAAGEEENVKTLIERNTQPISLNDATDRDEPFGDDRIECPCVFNKGEDEEDEDFEDEEEDDFEDDDIDDEEDGDDDELDDDWEEVEDDDEEIEDEDEDEDWDEDEEWGEEDWDEDDDDEEWDDDDEEEEEGVEE